MSRGHRGRWERPLHGLTQHERDAMEAEAKSEMAWWDAYLRELAHDPPDQRSHEYEHEDDPYKGEATYEHEHEYGPRHDGGATT